MQEPVPGQAADLGAIEPPVPSRPAQDFWREETGRGVPDVAPAIAPDATPDMMPGPVAPPTRSVTLSQFEPIHPDWQEALAAEPDIWDDMLKRAEAAGVDPSDFDDLDALDNAINEASTGPKLADFVETAEQIRRDNLGVARPMDIPVESPQNVGGTGLPAGPRVGQPPAPRTAAEGRAYIESLSQPAGTTREALMPPPVAPPARDALARVAMLADQPVTPKPLVRPAKPKAPTPDRVLRLGRGVHDSVRAIFPDRLHADLFSAFGRARKIMRGEKNVIPPDYEGLAKQMGVSVKDVQRIASEYRLKVLQQAKALPEYAPEGTDVIDMEAPHWGGKTEMVKAAPEAPPAAPPPVAATIPEAPPVAAAIPEVAPSVDDVLKGELKALGAKPQKPPVVQRPALPKSKTARVTAVMDELMALDEAEIASIRDDPAKLLARAKGAGIKSATLKSAIVEWFKEVGGSETGALKVGPSDKRMAELKSFHKSFMEKIKAGIPDAREQGELDNAIVKIYKEMNPGLKLDPKNARAKKALDLVRAIRVKNPEGSTGKWALKDIPADVIAASRKIRELTYGKLKLEKEDIINHYLDTGKVELPEPEFDADDPFLTNTQSNLQAWLKKAGGSEKGALTLPSKQQLVAGWEKTFDVANSVRMTSMLSGLALPKSVAGNVGAHLAAALEGKSLKPLKVLGNMKAIAADIKVGWQSHANPALVTGMNKANLPGRAMGALDFASIESLKRAGLTEAQAKELLLTGANQISSWWPLETRLGKLIVPFRTTPFNQFAQGITRWKKHPYVYAAAVALGAASGAKVEDKEGIAMLSALAGPYAIPFLVGAWAGSGNMEMLNSISPMPEWGITKTIANPFGAFTESPGRRWVRSNLGFGKQAAKEKRRESGRTVGTGSGRSRGGRGRGR